MSQAEAELSEILESVPERVRTLAKDLRQEFIVKQRQLTGLSNWRLPQVWDNDSLWERVATCAIWAGADARTYIEVSASLIKPSRTGEKLFANALHGDKCRNNVRNYMVKARHGGKVNFENDYMATQTRTAEAASGTSAKQDWEKFLAHLRSHHPLPAPVARVILSGMDYKVLNRYRQAAIRELDGKPEFETRLKSAGIDIRAS